MAGSLTWRQYQSDDGTTYAIKVDESNARGAITGGTADPLCPVRTANIPPLYKGIRPRYVLAYNSAVPTQRRKFVIGDKTLLTRTLTIGATITAEQYPSAGDAPGSNVTWVITYFGGERQKLIPTFSSVDTGLTDGTPGQ